MRHGSADVHTVTLLANPDVMQRSNVLQNPAGTPLALLPTCHHVLSICKLVVEAIFASSCAWQLAWRVLATSSVLRCACTPNVSSQSIAVGGMQPA